MSLGAEKEADERQPQIVGNVWRRFMSIREESGKENVIFCTLLSACSVKEPNDSMKMLQRFSERV